MPNSNNNNTVLSWSASNTVSLNTANRVLSDAVSINANAVQGAIRVNAVNGSSPVSGDTVDLWASWSVDGTAFDTDEHSLYLGRLDTFLTNDPGENPAAKTFDLNVSGKRSFKLIARAAQGASRAITLSAVYNEHQMN